MWNNSATNLEYKDEFVSAVTYLTKCEFDAMIHHVIMEVQQH